MMNIQGQKIPDQWQKVRQQSETAAPNMLTY